MATMSNEIDLGNNTVRFTAEDIDIAQLAAILQAAEANTSSATGEQMNLTGIKELLVGAVAFDPDGGVSITFQKPDISFTWRDFKWLINQVIRPLMRQPRTHTFRISDNHELLQAAIHGQDTDALWQDLTLDFSKGIVDG